MVKVGPKLDKTYVYDNKTGKLTEKSGGDAQKVDFEHTKLYQDQTVHYRISTINNARPRVQLSNTSFAKSATTKKALASDDPGGLVVKARGSSMIQVMWNARADDIQAAPVTGYKIESSPLDADGDCMEDWSVLVEDTMSTTTSYTHGGLAPETGQCYRIFGINVVATSTSFVGYGDAYVTTNDNDAIATTSERMNTAPTAGAAITDQTVRVDATVMVQSTITDADTDDTLTWSAMSNMPTYATATVDNMGMVTITGVAEGMATITVTATDIADATATQDIMVTVAAANTAPMAVGMIAPVTVTEGQMSDAMDVSGYFSDADTGDTLTYTAMSDMTSYATVSVSGSMLTITGVAPGSATVTVTATDTAGDYDMQTIMVTVDAAEMTLGNAMALMATQGEDPGDVTLTWTPGADATVHWVAGVRIVNDAIDPNFTPIWHAATGDGTHTVNAPTAGDYVFAVIAGRTSDGTTEWSSWTIHRYTRE